MAVSIRTASQTSMGVLSTIKRPVIEAADAGGAGFSASDRQTRLAA